MAERYTTTIVTGTRDVIENGEELQIDIEREVTAEIETGIGAHSGSRDEPPDAGDCEVIAVYDTKTGDEITDEVDTDSILRSYIRFGH